MTDAYNVTAAELRAFVERIEHQAETIAGEKDALKEIFDEAKASGYDVKILRKVVAMRKKTRDELATEEAVTATYAAALGMS